MHLRPVPEQAKNTRGTGPAGGYSNITLLSKPLFSINVFSAFAAKLAFDPETYIKRKIQE